MESAEDAVLGYVKEGGEENSDAYQDLFETFGERLLPTLLDLCRHESPELRAVAAAMLATRRPHTQEMVEAFSHLLSDLHIIVRIKTLLALLDFDPDLAAPLIPTVEEIVENPKDSDDQVERALAMDCLLIHGGDSSKYVPELFKILRTRSESGVLSLAGIVAMEALMRCGAIEEVE
jgi:HEAT repeat protein